MRNGAFDPDAPPAVQITQVGRWRYAIRITRGLTVTDPPWTAWGHNRAKRKAQRKLRRYLRREQRERAAETLSLAELEADSGA